MGLTNLRSKSSSNADRKFEKKLKFYEKVKESVAALNANKTINKKRTKKREKKLKAYDLSALSEFLPDVNEPKQPAVVADHKLNSKSRHKLVLKEGKQLQTVLNHPVFQSAPLAAIHQHLLSTQPVVEEKPSRREKKNGSKKKKGKKSQSTAGRLAMEM